MMLVWGQWAAVMAEGGSTIANLVDSAPKSVNVVATGSVDQMIKV